MVELRRAKESTFFLHLKHLSTYCKSYSRQPELNLYPAGRGLLEGYPGPISQLINGHGFLVGIIVGTIRKCKRDPMSTLHGLWVALILTMSHMLTFSCPLELNPYNEPPKRLVAARMDLLLILKILHGLNIL